MAQIANITGSTWATSGSASTGSTGLNALTGTITHVGSTDVPPGSAATGYLATAEAASLAFRIDASGSVGTQHWLRFWAYADQIGDVDTNSSNAGNHFRLIDWSGGSFRIINEHWLVAESQYKSAGLRATASVISGGGVGNAPFANTSVGAMPLNEWVEITVHVNQTTSIVEVFLNGCLYCWWTGNDMSTPKTSLDLLLGGTTGVQWRLCAPIESWSGSDIAVTPKETLRRDQDCRYWMHTLATATKGVYWTGSGYDATTYSASGANPERRRAVFSGAGDFTSTAAIGSPPWNADGWFSAWNPSVYVPTGTCTVSIRNADDTADAAAIVFHTSGEIRDKDGAQLTASDGTALTFSTSIRYAVGFCLHRNGTVNFGIFDHSSSASTTRKAWSGSLGSWGSGSVGKLKVVASASTIESDGFLLGQYVPLLGADSLSATAATSVTPNMQTTNNVSYRLPFRACEGFPGGEHAHRAAGLDYLPAMLFVGRSGGKLSEMYTGVLQHLTAIRGVQLWLIDPSINDITSSASVATMAGLIEDCIEWAKASRNRLVFSNVSQRPAAGSGAGTETVRGVCKASSLAYRDLWQSYGANRAYKPYLAYVPSVSDYIETAAGTGPYDGGDGTHPYLTGNGTLAANFLAGVASREWSNLPAAPSNGVVRSVIR